MCNLASFWSRPLAPNAQVYLRIFDLQHQKRGMRGYLPLAAAGYAAGLLLTYGALYFSLFGDQVRRYIVRIFYVLTYHTLYLL